MYSTTSRSMAPTFITLFFLLLFPFTFAGSNCPPLGPVLPAPKSPSSNNAVQFALVGLSAEFETLASSYNATAISIAVASIHEKGPMLDLGHTPSVHNKRGTKKVDINTVYRIASVSKVFTVLALLQLKGKINLADPVTKYVPELRQLKKQEDTINDITTVDWDEVTIDALASQLSDIGQNCTLSLKSVATKARWLTFVIIVGEDLRNQDIPYTELGFPVLPPEAASMCGGAPGERGCTRGGKMQHIPNPTLHRLIIISDFFAKFGKRHPVYAPYTTPVYSNIAYTILGFVIEAATHDSYENYMQRAIFKPLNMTRTTVGKPSKDNIGFIPSETNWWSTDLGIENPSGGIYTSARDLLTFGRAVLSSSLLTPLQTRQWLKPHTHTSSLGVSVGSPWEIARANNVTVDKRVIDFYTKTGGLGDYNSILVLIPDYDLVIVLLSAGPGSTAGFIYGLVSQLIETLLPAIETAGKAEARAKFAGEYHAGSGTNITGTITLSLDNGPGLKLTNWTSDGKDILSEYLSLAIDSSGPSPDLAISARMYPTNLQTKNQTAWRAVFDIVNADGSPLDASQLFFIGGDCTSWSSIDLTIYGLNGLDDFVFDLDKHGRASSVTSRALRRTMGRVA